MFSRPLIHWYLRHKRDLPWRQTTDPYRIWVSEIMLQQTRAAAVIPYYERFLARFPDVQSLASAPLDDVLHAWSGLGYYSRARNLHAAAAVIAASGFPQTYEAIRTLKGVGDYTAAAIASIAFSLPHVVLDGNVLRVMSRLLDDPGDISAPKVRQRLRDAAQSALDPRRPSDFNQALMELGATICLPREPLCLLCPLAAQCQARLHGVERQRPVKLKKSETLRQDRYVLLIERRGKLLFRQRPSEARRLAGFWELPEGSDLPDAQLKQPLGNFQHSIVNHQYTVFVVPAVLHGTPKQMKWFSLEEIGVLPLTTESKKCLDLRRRSASVTVTNGV